MNAALKRLIRRKDWTALQRLASEDDARKRRVRQKAKPRRQAKAEKREERNARIAQIRAEVWLIADGICELCQQPESLGGARVDWAASHLHHVLGGPDRRKREAVDTCIALCHYHHEYVHLGGRKALRRVAAIRRLSPEARASVERRLARAESMNTRRGA